MNAETKRALARLLEQRFLHKPLQPSEAKLNRKLVDELGGKQTRR